MRLGDWNYIVKSFAVFALSTAIFSSAFAGVEIVEIGKIQITKTLTGTVVDPLTRRCQESRFSKCLLTGKPYFALQRPIAMGSGLSHRCPGNKFITFASSLMASTHCKSALS